MASARQYRCAADYRKAGWLALKAQALDRCAGACEFCGALLDSVTVLHHRLYPKYGPDTLRILMLVHPDCHDAIHFGGHIRARQGSLAALGDNGKGNTALWRAYLRRVA